MTIDNHTSAYKLMVFGNIATLLYRLNAQNLKTSSSTEMSVIYTVDPALNMIYFACFGHCSGQALLRAENQSAKHRHRQPNMLIIVDLQLVSELDVGLEDLRQLIAINQQIVASGQVPERTAFIFRNANDLPLHQAYQLLTESTLGLRMGAFMTLSDALNWLGLAKHDDQVRRVRSDLHERALNSDPE